MVGSSTSGPTSTLRGPGKGSYGNEALAIVATSSDASVAGTGNVPRHRGARPVVSILPAPGHAGDEPQLSSLLTRIEARDGRGWSTAAA